MLNTKPLLERGVLLNRKMLTQSQFSQIQFSAVLNNYTMFYNVAKAISFVDHATVQLSADGVKVVVEDCKSVQATAYITKACFSDYQLGQRKRKSTAMEDDREDADDNEPLTSFGLNLKVFTDCLSMFMDGDYDSSMKMLHKGEGAPLVVILERRCEDDLITECSVRTMEAQDILDFDFEEEHVCSKVSIKGQEFFALLSEMDRNSSEVELFLSPDAPHFKFSTFDELGSESSFEITNSSDMLISFHSTETTTNRYQFAHFKLVMKTLAFASKIALRTNKEGLLGLQVMIENSENSNIFVEYFVMPLCDVEANETSITYD
ncbi:cell cycle checkpoint protein RAD1-like [Aedes aegypti]|uniref:Cell cycle checkpoint protein RAD1 n=1 Tax=Aedes aegypti TaxID=7159 RepID=A0A6I8TIH7_AEDAE|nr:cell cycle checkpoint protein RAD1-like [Aedes aegypti]XP_021705986.1 cell cycle checkpoint protein RAD1-like [Aedes aegypti]XP_021705987.1 cell cycle checkpoint protein RAD1-like [Aedes aegypti]